MKAGGELNCDTEMVHKKSQEALLIPCRLERELLNGNAAASTQVSSDHMETHIEYVKDSQPYPTQVCTLLVHNLKGSETHLHWDLQGRS
jgi:hypothetical protein